MKEGNKWLYKPETVENCSRIYGDKPVEIRYILGEKLNHDSEKVLICIGINPSTATPEKLDPTLIRVQDYANRQEYGAWYMLNIYPQRATNPKDMHLDDTFSMEIHLQNLRAIESLLSTIEEADVWCAWGAIIDDKKRKYLSDCLYGDSEKGIKGIISLFNGDYIFKAYGVSRKEYPRHPLILKKIDYLQRLKDVKLEKLSDKINDLLKNK